MVAHYVGASGNCGYDWNGIAFVNRWQCDQIDQVGSGLAKMGLSLVVDGTAPVMAYMDSNDGYQTTVKLAQPPGDWGWTWATVDQLICSTLGTARRSPVVSMVLVGR